MCSLIVPIVIPFFFFFNDTATTEIYPLPLHDALPISAEARPRACGHALDERRRELDDGDVADGEQVPSRRHSPLRSEEHTSELQSRLHLVCRLLLEKKNSAS